MGFQICRKCGKKRVPEPTLAGSIQLVLCKGCIEAIKAEIALPPDADGLEPEPSPA